MALLNFILDLKFKLPYQAVWFNWNKSIESLDAKDLLSTLYVLQNEEVILDQLHPVPMD